VHGEVTDPEVDIFEREPRFLTTVLTPLLAAHPQLRVVLEHITTREAVAFVNAAGPNVAATITVHHLMYNRNGAARAGGGRGGGAGTFLLASAFFSARLLLPARAHPSPLPPLPLFRSSAAQTSSRAASARTATACPS
jgi:hypothetical protein